MLHFLTTEATKSRPLDCVLRALQLVFAVIIMGTDGSAIHTFQGHPVHVQSEYVNFYGFTSVPDAWGFLMFCAAWTFLAVILHFIAGAKLIDRAWTRYVHVGVETVAVLSWLAGFVAVAVEIATETCPAGSSSCGSLIAATVFGGFEWMLFMITAGQAIMVFFSSSRNVGLPTTTSVEAK